MGSQPYCTRGQQVAQRSVSACTSLEALVVAVNQALSRQKEFKDHTMDFIPELIVLKFAPAQIRMNHPLKYSTNGCTFVQL